MAVDENLNNHQQKDELTEFTQQKFCAFLSQDCIGDKCAQRVEVQVGTAGPFGVVAGKKVKMCVFPALLMVMSSLIGAVASQKLPISGNKFRAF